MMYEQLIFKCSVGNYIELSYEHFNVIKIYEGEVISIARSYLGLRINEFDANGDIHSVIRSFSVDNIRCIVLISDNDFDLGI